MIYETLTSELEEGGEEGTTEAPATEGGAAPVTEGATEPETDNEEL